MILTVDSFLDFFNGIYCDYDGAYGDQCFDLANAYSRWIGGQRFGGATADLIFVQPGDFYEAIPNSPIGFPQKGDIVIWNWPHVGIATGNNTDTNQFEVLEQNDPAESNCHIKVYKNYNGVIGWLRPKVLPILPEPEKVDPDKVKVFIGINPQTGTNYGDQEVGAVRSTIFDLEKKSHDLANVLTLATNKPQQPVVITQPVAQPVVVTTPIANFSTSDLFNELVRRVTQKFKLG